MGETGALFIRDRRKILSQERRFRIISEATANEVGDTPQHFRARPVVAKNGSKRARAAYLRGQTSQERLVNAIERREAGRPRGMLGRREGVCPKGKVLLVVPLNHEMWPNPVGRPITWAGHVARTDRQL